MHNAGFDPTQVVRYIVRAVDPVLSGPNPGFPLGDPFASATNCDRHILGWEGRWGTDPMKSRSFGETWPGPEYRISVSFRAPVDFVFAWCTDYTPGDAALEKEKYQRKIIERTRRSVVFEDLEESRDGWDWSRALVSLYPPNRWHMDGIGNNRDVVADYALSRLPDGGTRLDLRWKRRPHEPEATRLSKAQREAASTQAWKRFASALERDYKQSGRARTKRRK
jgi:hypothetical protein